MENSLYYCILTRLEVHHIQESSQHNFRFKASSKEAPDTEKEWKIKKAQALTTEFIILKAP